MARWYYYPGDESNVLERVRNRVFRKPVPDFPKTILIETQFGCNAKCVFCQSCCDWAAGDPSFFAFTAAVYKSSIQKSTFDLHR